MLFTVVVTPLTSSSRTSNFGISEFGHPCLDTLNLKFTARD